MSAAIRTEPEERQRLRSAKCFAAERALRGVTVQLRDAQAVLDAALARLEEAERRGIEALAIGRAEDRHAIEAARNAHVVASGTVARLAAAEKIAADRLAEVRKVAPTDAELEQLDAAVESALGNLVVMLRGFEGAVSEAGKIIAVARAATDGPGLVGLSMLVDVIIRKVQETRQVVATPSFKGWRFMG